MALYTVTNGNTMVALDIDQLTNLLTGNDTSTPVTVNNRIQAITPDAWQPSGYVGGTTGGAPTSGTFLAGDFLVDQLGFMWVCVTGGTPGTWYRQGGGNYACVAVQTTSQTLTSRSGQSGFDTLNLNALQDTHSDPHAMFSSSVHGITVPVAGYYLCSGVVGTNGAVATWSQAAILLKNGTATARGTEMIVTNGGNAIVTDLISCAANDVIKLGSYTEHLCNVNTATGATMLSACLIT